MEQMNMAGMDLLKIDYHSGDLPYTIQKLKPNVYRNGAFFCCLFGPDPREGIFGCGNTPEQAMANWNAQLRDRLTDHYFGDEVAESALVKLSETENDD